MEDAEPRAELRSGSASKASPQNETGRPGGVDRPVRTPDSRPTAARLLWRKLLRSDPLHRPLRPLVRRFAGPAPAQGSDGRMCLGLPPQPPLGTSALYCGGGRRAVHGGGMHGPVRVPATRSDAGHISTSGSSRRGPPRGHHGRCRFAQAWAVIGAVTRAVSVALARDVAGGETGTTVPDATTDCGSRWRIRGAGAEDLPSPETQKAPSTEVEEASMARIALGRAPVSSEHAQYTRWTASRQ